MVVAAVNDTYGCHFPVPDRFLSRLTSFDAFREAKEFFSGLLDALNGAGTHQWLDLVIGLPMKTRLAIASSLTSGKKLLPDPCPGMLRGVEEKHRSLMKEAFPVSDSRFEDHLLKTVDQFFPVGWDRGYLRSVESVSLPLSAGVDLPRSKGGVASSGMGRDELGKACLGIDEEFPFTNHVKFCSVITEGKVRGITINHKEHHVLRPLHNVLYDHLSRFGWLLRGDARTDRFADFRYVDGRVFVSGDYETATDGLSTEVSELILDSILSRCRYVPVSVRSWAQKSLRSRIEYSDGSVIEQQRGQLMGNLLSFPLLCLYNYIVFKYFVKRRVPLRINGDDIVTQLKREEYDAWANGLGDFGMKLSAGKTFVHHKYFAINSTYFWATENRVELMEVLRLGMLRKPESLGGLGAAHGKFVEPFRRKHLRQRVSALFLRSHNRELRRTGRSLTAPEPKGLGVRCGVWALGRAGLLEREAWYLENFSPRRKFAKTPSAHNLEGIPDGWRKTRRKMDVRERLAWGIYLGAEMLERKWGTQVVALKQDWDDYWFRTRADGGEGLWRRYVAERRSGAYQKQFRLLCKAGYRSKFNPMKLKKSLVYRSVSELGRSKVNSDVWVKDEGRREIMFMKQSLPTA